jgi:microcin C transport system substrate-binding protein
LSISRRHLLQGTAALASASFPLAKLGSVAQAQTEATNWRHSLSLFGEIKYPAGFRHFDYINPNAPKGGVARQIALGTFDSFNIVVAGAKGAVAPGVARIYETLMASSLDEVSTEYGLLVEQVAHPDDFAWATYRLRKEARWHDGKPVTPEDVIFSFEQLKKLSPRYASYYSHVVKAEKIGDQDVRFTFDQPGNRELPVIVGQLLVLPKHWWEGKDKEGKPRDISATTLEPPLGSGPYRVKEFSAGRTLVLERVKDYWGEKLPVNIGQNNFDELRYEFFRDNIVALEAFKADQADWIIENSAKQWATAYDFPAVRDKRVVLEEFSMRSSGRMQGYVFNLRRDLFKDARFRRAFNYAYDFEEMNKQLFHGQYKRIKSYFEGTELASEGLPTGKELEILETVRGRVPAEVFTTAYTNPVNGNAENVRNNRREALRLFKEAGFEIKDQKLVDPGGKQVTVEMLIQQDPSSERLVLFYKPSLERLGINVTVRAVDNVQYQNRLRSFDFDIITDLFGQSLSPGNEQLDYWGSRAADQPGSNNTIGIKNPAIDELIQKVIFAKDRATLEATTKALDRVLLWNHYVVPQFTYGFARYARWDRFSHADPLPKYGTSGLPSIWWWDAAKAAKTGGRT